MSRCPDAQRLSAFVLGELEGAGRNEIAAHVADCPACGDVVAWHMRIFEEHSGDRSVGGPYSGSGELDVTAAGADEVPRRTDQLEPGAVVGRYRVLERVGAGAMGVVYAAYDPELDRRIALKLLGGVGASTERRSRMMREAQALARLSHPNVVAVHDVGTHEDRVFLAMEFVAGTTLGGWLGRGEHSWREIREVFSAAGRGLAAAHEAGIVHRDFKPDNVLLETGPDEAIRRVRVTDFGLARLRAIDVDPETSSDDDVGDLASTSLTQTGALLGTPAYMAPEQLSRGEIDARADQFAFCVTLYEAVWGKRPFSGKSLAELSANVIEGRLAPPPRDRRLPAPAKEAIMRGLSPDRNERFSDIKALLAELERDPGARRRRLALLSLPVVGLGLGIAAFARSSGPELAVCRDDGLRGVWDGARKRAIRDAFGATEAAYAEDSWRRLEAGIDAYARRWRTLRQSACSLDEVETSPGTLALRMACLQRRRQTLDATLAVLAEADRDVVTGAVTIPEKLPSLDPCEDVSTFIEAAPEPPDPSARADVEGIRRRIADAHALLLAGKYAAGEAEARVAVEQAQAVDHGPVLAEALEQHGKLLDRLGRLDEAQDALFEAAAQATISRHRLHAARALVELVYVLGRERHAFDHAHRIARQAQAEIEALGLSGRLEAALVTNVGTLLFDEGKVEEAIETWQRAYELNEGAPLRQADVRFNIGGARVALGEYEQAKTEFEASLRVWSEAAGPDHPEVASHHHNLGLVLLYTGKTKQAIVELEAAARTRRRSLGNHPEYAHTLGALGMVRLRLGEIDEAIALSQQALSIMVASAGENNLDTVGQRLKLASALTVAERFDEAAEHCDAAIAVVTERLEPSHPYSIDAYSTRAAVRHGQGRLAEALADTELAVEAANEGLGSEHPDTGELLTMYGDMLAEAGRTDEAVEAYERAISIGERSDAALDFLPDARLSLAEALWRIPRHRPRARTLAERALTEARKRSPVRGVEDIEAWLSTHPVP